MQMHRKKKVLIVLSQGSEIYLYFEIRFSHESVYCTLFNVHFPKTTMHVNSLILKVNLCVQSKIQHSAERNWWTKIWLKIIVFLCVNECCTNWAHEDIFNTFVQWKKKHSYENERTLMLKYILHVHWSVNHFCLN